MYGVINNFIFWQRPLLPRDSGEYIYCLQKHKNNLRVPYNPYNLQAVSASTAMHSKEYWTVTASFVSKVVYYSKIKWRFPYKEHFAFHLLPHPSYITLVSEQLADPS